MAETISCGAHVTYTVSVADRVTQRACGYIYINLALQPVLAARGLPEERAAREEESQESEYIRSEKLSAGAEWAI
jgi:hypothetical protein